MLNQTPTNTTSNVVPKLRIHKFDEITKFKIAFEEWISNEFELLAKQHSDSSLLKTRFIAINALLLRPNKSISGVWYEITPEDDIWVIFSLPIIRKLDQSLFHLFVKIVLDTLHLLRKGQFQTSATDAEIQAYNSYIDDMKRIHAKKALQSAERLKQVLYLLTIQSFRQKPNLPIFEPKSKIPIKSDKNIQKLLNSSLARVKNRIFNYSTTKSVQITKCRVIPYLFTELIPETNQLIKENPLRIKPAQSFIVKDSQGRNIFAITLISTYILENLIENKNEESLDYILAYELLSVQGSGRARSGMEKEIYLIISDNKDDAENKLYQFYSKETIQNAKKKIDELLSQFIRKNFPILRVYD